MVKVTYKEFAREGVLSIRAEGHAGYAEKGKDIVCAAVSTLMQTLAYSVDDGESGGAVGFDMGKDGPVFSVQARNTHANRAKFELVVDGLDLIAEQYPDHVTVKDLNMDDADAMDLQMFAEGGEGSAPSQSPDGDSSTEAASDGGKTSQALRASSPSRGALGTSAAALLDEEGPAGQKSEGSATEGSGSEDEGEEKKPTPEQRRAAFGKMMSGEYKDLADEMMQKAVNMAMQQLEASPQIQGLMSALAEKYGTDAADLDALTEAVKNGRVKDDAYYEKLAMEKGVSVKTARELDKLETQNKRLTAQQELTQRMQREAEQRARIAEIQAEWDREAEALKTRYPDFDRAEVLANPEVERMMRAGVGMEAAYRAVYFDRILAQQTAATAKQVEQGVVNRVEQRSKRPGENGTRPGGAVQTHIDVNNMSRKDREALEKRVLRGEIITL